MVRLPSRPAFSGLVVALLPTLGALLAAGCGDTKAKQPDLGFEPVRDLGGLDSGPIPTGDARGADAAAPASDAAVVPADAAVPPPADAAVVPPADAVAPMIDAAAVPSDAAVVPPGDASVVPPSDAAAPQPDWFFPFDGGPPPVVLPDAFAGDACEIPADNLIVNGGFEDADADGQPVGWGGDTTNLVTEGHVVDTHIAHCGAASLQFINEGGTHKRYSLAIPNIRAGQHSLVYWVRGHGEIRNAWYGADYSSYHPAGYLAVDSDDWQRVTYDFSVDVDRAAGFEVIFSLRNTVADRDDLQIDDVTLVRLAGLCDNVVCPDWAACDGGSGQCAPLFDRCADDTGCPDWAACDADHRCAPRPGRCGQDADCAATPDVPMCDVDTNTCIPGDPCAGVNCLNWQMCVAGACQADPDRCRTSANCLGDLPVCVAATATCAAIDDAANLVRNGGFEDWTVRPIPYHGDSLVPDFWWGQATPADTEIDPANLSELDAGHSGAHACGITFPGMPADRFVTEPFNLPGGTYTCGYWVRGHGDFVHRWYSASGWGPQQVRFNVDSDVWAPQTFTIVGNIRDLRLIFYASNTLPDRGHIQLDDVFCTRNP